MGMGPVFVVTREARRSWLDSLRKSGSFGPKWGFDSERRVWRRPKRGRRWDKSGGDRSLVREKEPEEEKRKRGRKKINSTTAETGSRPFSG